MNIFVYGLDTVFFVLSIVDWSLGCQEYCAFGNKISVYM